MSSLRNTWDNLTERERKALTLLGFVFGTFLIGSPLAIAWVSLSALEEGNVEIESVLSDIHGERDKIAMCLEKQQATAQRYANEAPPLGSFMEQKAREVELTVREANDQPEREAAGYRRRAVRVQFPGISLKPIVNLLGSVASSPYPVAVESIELEHYQTGDRFNARVGVMAYDKLRPTTAARAENKNGEAAEGGNNDNGPPAPP